MKKLLMLTLVAIGLLQSIGHLFGLDAVKKAGFVTVASPLPIVFTKQKGKLETFSLQYALIVKKEGRTKRIVITPKLYKHFDAPYNFRNVLGAAISYAPLLDTKLRNAVYRYAFVDPAPLAKALKVDKSATLSLELQTKERGVNQRFIYPIKGANNDEI